MKRNTNSRRIYTSRIAWIAAGAYIVECLCTAGLPYAQQEPVSEEFAATISTANFYGDGPCGDRVALIEAPEDGFSIRLQMLSEATERIDVSYYAMHMGESTDVFLGALLDAADRGVQVRILVDGMFGGLTKYHPIYATALGAHPNIELTVYNTPWLLEPWTWNARLHDKYIIVDDNLLLLGGRNIGDKYFAWEGYDGPISYDRDVLVYHGEEIAETGVLWEVRAYMDGILCGNHVTVPYAKDSQRAMQKRQALISTYADYAVANPEIFQFVENYEIATVSANCVTFFHNDTGIGPKEPKVAYTVREMLLSAEDSVTMQSPYVILDDNLEDTLRQLGAQEITADILTNSMASSPNPLACTGYYLDRGRILESGISVWEYQSVDSIHAKSYLIDGRMALVGSYNMDPRSAYIDTELMLAIDSEEFADQLQSAQQIYQNQSLPLDADGQYRVNPQTDAEAVSLLKQIRTYVLYPGVWMFKYLV